MTIFIIIKMLINLCIVTNIILFKISCVICGEVFDLLVIYNIFILKLKQNNKFNDMTYIN